MVNIQLNANMRLIYR